MGLRVAFGLSFDVFGVFLLTLLLLLHSFRSLRRIIYKKRRGVWGEGCHVESDQGLADDGKRFDALDVHRGAKQRPLFDCF